MTLCLSVSTHRLIPCSLWPLSVSGVALGGAPSRARQARGESLVTKPVLDPILLDPM